MALKILIISSEFPPGPGGIGRHAYSLVKALLHYGCSVTVISDMDYATEEEIRIFLSEQPEGLQINRVFRRGYKTYLDRIRMTLKSVHQNSFDKIIVTGKVPIWIGAYLKLQFGKRLKVEAFIHGSEVKPKHWLKRLITLKSLEIINKVWAVSKFTRSLLPSTFGNISIMPNGLNISDWPESPNEIESFDWPGHPKLLTVGNVTPRKGQHRIVAALPELVKEFPNIHYHIVGLPTNAEMINALAIKLGVSGHITIHGRLPNHMDLLRAYKSADIFCMLSENQTDGDVEGFGIAILEANIMGLPIIGSNENGIVDAVDEGKTGILIDGANIRSLSNAINEISSWDKDITCQTCISWSKKFDWNVLIEPLLT